MIMLYIITRSVDKKNTSLKNVPSDRKMATFHYLLWRKGPFRRSMLFMNFSDIPLAAVCFTWCMPYHITWQHDLCGCLISPLPPSFLVTLLRASHFTSKSCIWVALCDRTENITINLCLRCTVWKYCAQMGCCAILFKFWGFVCSANMWLERHWCSQSMVAFAAGVSRFKALPKRLWANSNIFAYWAVPSIK